jgi:hypothetical protein
MKVSVLMQNIADVEYNISIIRNNPHFNPCNVAAFYTAYYLVKNVFQVRCWSCYSQTVCMETMCKFIKHILSDKMTTINLDNVLQQLKHIISGDIKNIRDNFHEGYDIEILYGNDGLFDTYNFVDVPENTRLMFVPRGGFTVRHVCYCNFSELIPVIKRKFNRCCIHN